jgi:coproporphyrinogen III oxidase-like Fe-S oxidoreductase
MIGFGLRIKNGINLNQIPKSYLNMVNESIERNQSKWGDYYILGGNRLKLTPQGFVFADTIAVDLMIPVP